MSFLDASDRFRAKQKPEFNDEVIALSVRLADVLMTGQDTDPGAPWSLELYYPSEYLLKLSRLRERPDWPECLLDDPYIAPYWAHYHVGRMQ